MRKFQSPRNSKGWSPPPPLQLPFREVKLQKEFHVILNLQNAFILHPPSFNIYIYTAFPRISAHVIVSAHPSISHNVKQTPPSNERLSPPPPSLS